MEKKGSWFSAITRVFTHHSKEKQVPNDSENKSSKDKKKKGLGKLRHGETNSFIPLFREPSSIEKIFRDFEREQQLLSVRPPMPLEQPKPAPVVPPRAASPRAPSPRAPSPRVASFRNEIPPEFLNTLSKMAPSQEEEQKLRLFTGDLHMLGPADRFLKAIVDIPLAFKRIETLHYMCTLSDELITTRNSFGVLEVVIQYYSYLVGLCGTSRKYQTLNGRE
ncbi:hypothetical protein Ahy_A08g039726 [Arachis hypogaea]|uniref:FH2 domain-containing protein n=1 Tax=Arachis hypogaea TaxID=3818 RepID=A0A445BXN1_ARAHY|nr:hypothetical protein Ahy_A08g039726 [Arachis hypogaea]